MAMGERLKEAREKKEYTQKQLAELVGARHNSISNWEKGKNKPSTFMIERLCSVLEVSPSYLISGDGSNFDFSDVENVRPLTKKKIPILGEIACGQPIFCNQEFESYIDAGTGVHADFAVRAKGDSMINARIHDGDIVFIRSQPMVENGEIAAVCIGNEATLKRVYISKDTVTLVAENPAYAPIVCKLDESTNIFIMGKAIAFQSNL